MKEETEPLKEKLINKVVIRRESTDDKSRVKSKLATVEKVNVGINRIISLKHQKTQN